MVGNVEKRQPFMELLLGLTSQARSLILTLSHFAGEGSASERLSHTKSASVSSTAGTKLGSKWKLVGGALQIHRDSDKQGTG